MYAREIVTFVNKYLSTYLNSLDSYNLPKHDIRVKLLFGTTENAKCGNERKKTRASQGEAEDG